MNRPVNWREAAIVTVLMLGTFALIMTAGYWARFERAVWDDICWAECER